MRVDSAPVVVPDDLSSLSQSCQKFVGTVENHHRCGAPASWRLLVACPGCDGTRAIAVCGPHKNDRNRNVTLCCLMDVVLVGCEVI